MQTEDKYKEIGLLLKNRREDLNMSISTIANELVVKAFYIEKIENGEYDEIAKKIYYYGYVKAIAKQLQLPDDNLLNYLLDKDKTDLDFAVRDSVAMEAVLDVKNFKSLLFFVSSVVMIGLGIYFYWAKHENNDTMNSKSNYYRDGIE